LAEKRPPYLSCRAKVAQVLALEAERLGKTASVDSVFAFSTATHSDERADVSRVFGGQILSFYSSKEAHLMAYQCVAGHHLHINEEIVLVEILGNDGNPVQSGLPGRVVVTNLLNWAQPLIRYEHGDLAVEKEGACACGRSLRSLEKVVGRQTDMFRFSDGKVVAFAFPENVKAALNIKTWQVAQIGPMLLEVRYSRTNASMPLDEAAVAAAVKQRTHPSVDVLFSETTNFLPVDGRKFAEYTNEYY